MFALAEKEYRLAGRRERRRYQSKVNLLVEERYRAPGLNSFLGSYIIPPVCCTKVRSIDWPFCPQASGPTSALLRAEVSQISFADRKYEAPMLCRRSFGAGVVGNTCGVPGCKL